MMENTVIKKENTVTKERSAAYPAIPIESALGLSLKLQNAFGKSAFSRENAVQQMGYNKVTGPNGMKVSALVHYGLLSRVGSSYKNNELSLKLAHSIDEIDRKKAIQQAALNPKLFKDLIKKFSGSTIPLALKSILVRDHGINSKVADDVANTFKKSMESAGLLVNGIISTDIDQSEPNESIESNEILNETDVNKNDDSKKITPKHSENQMPSHTTETTTVKLPSGILIIYPNSLAYSFAIGAFGKEIAAFEEAVQKVTEGLKE